MISLVAAMTRTHVIGKGDRLPWSIKEEVKHYRHIVKGKTVIMGRRTFEMMKGNLPGSHNIVVAHDALEYPRTKSCQTVEDAIRLAKSYSTAVYILGGQSIFEQALPFADTMQLSFIKKNYEGDKFFPKFSMKEWRVESREDFLEFEYVIFKRIRKSRS